MFLIAPSLLMFFLFLHVLIVPSVFLFILFLHDDDCTFTSNLLSYSPCFQLHLLLLFFLEYYRFHLPIYCSFFSPMWSITPSILKFFLFLHVVNSTLYFTVIIFWNIIACTFLSTVISFLSCFQLHFLFFMVFSFPPCCLFESFSLPSLKTLPTSYSHIKYVFCL